MADDLNDLIAAQGAMPGRPLLGMTILVVDDSRYASEALRLLCLRSGARIRRADCLRSAHRHLQTYRPTVAIVDLGLPDGSGVDLIARLAGEVARLPAILAISGDPAAEAAAMVAGADGFLLKPVESLAAFQNAVLGALPAGHMLVAPAGPGERVEPDPMALRDDLQLAVDLLEKADDDAWIAYVAQFLGGVAASAHDRVLAEAAAGLARDRRGGVAHVAGLVRDRLAAGAAF